MKPTRKVWALFHGGHSYACPTASNPADAEEFLSIGQAKRAMEARYYGWDKRFPCVDDSAEMHLFSAPPHTLRDPYPEKRIVVRPGTAGKHGTVHVEDC